jgi:predicted transcriptional regulator
MTGEDESEQNHPRVMRIRFRRGDGERLREALQALDRGEVTEPHFERVYHDPADIHRVMRPTNLELLSAIADDAPESIRDLARLVDRDVRHVHRNLQELAQLQLVRFDEGPRNAKRPVVWYDRLSIDVPLGDIGTPS